MHEKKHPSGLLLPCGALIDIVAEEGVEEVNIKRHAKVAELWRKCRWVLPPASYRTIQKMQDMVRVSLIPIKRGS